MTNYYDALLTEQTGLRTTQRVVLVVVYLAGLQTITDLAEQLALDRTTLTRMLAPGVAPPEAGQASGAQAERRDMSESTSSCGCTGSLNYPNR